MFKFTLKTGEHLWTPEGVHALDNRGIAIICKEDTEVEFNDEIILQRVKNKVEAARALKEANRKKRKELEELED